MSLQYSPHAAKVLADAERAQAIVSELDSELNEWVDSIPEHCMFGDYSGTPRPYY